MINDYTNITVYVGDNSPAFRVLMSSINEFSTSYNPHQIDGRSVVYVNTTDYEPAELSRLFFLSKEVIYVEPVKWSSKELQYHTIGWMEYVNLRRGIKMLKATEYGRGPIEFESNNFLKPNFLEPVCSRASTDRQAWLVGCSFTNGHGLEKTNQRFGQLFADSLKLPASFLTMNGASNQWAADQILKADIKPGDVVFWGITGIARSTIYTEEKPWPITINMLDKSKVSFYQSLLMDNSKIAPMRRMITEEFLLSDHSFFESINHIDQVYNYLKKLKVNFIIGYFADLDFPYLDHMGRMMHYIISKNDPRLHVIRPEYPWKDIIIRSPEDTNNDDTPVHHPGPQQHKIYANDLISLYNQLYN